MAAKKILVADDDPAIRKMLERFLKKRTYGMVVVENGLKAIYFAQSKKSDSLLPMPRCLTWMATPSAAC